MRLFAKILTLLSSLTLIAIATISLSMTWIGVDHVSTAQFLAEIGVGVASFYLFVGVTGRLWRMLVYVLLVIIAAQRLWILSYVVSDVMSGNLSFLMFAGHLTLVTAPAFALLASLILLSFTNVDASTKLEEPKATKPSNTRQNALRVLLFLSVIPVLALSFFSFIIGMDSCGAGIAVRITASFGVAGSVSAILFGLNPVIIHRRVATVILLSLTLALFIARSVEYGDRILLLSYNEFLTTLVIVIPLMLTLTLAIIFPIED